LFTDIGGSTDFKFKETPKMIKFKYNKETGKFIEAAAFDACKRRPQGDWVEVELTEAQAEAILAMEVKAESYERKFKRRECKETSSDDLYEKHDWEAVDKSVDIHVQVGDEDAFETMIAPLTKEREEIIRLRFRDGYTLEEIADKLGINKSSAKRRLDTALAQLRK